MSDRLEIVSTPRGAVAVRRGAAPGALAVSVYEEAALVLASALLFFWASRPAARWLVDDAGISYAYAMNAGLHGQLGTHLESWAAEGFSNPLTVAIVAALSALRVFHPLTTPRHLATVFFALQGLFSFRLLRDGLRTSRWIPWAAVAVFLILEICTPATMIWYGSGLENGLLSLAVVVLLRRLQVGIAADFSPRLDALLLILCALVRPEAAVFSIAWLLVAALSVASSHEAAIGLWARGRRLFATAAIAACLALVAAGARYALFASFLPNTFYAKLDVLDLHRSYVEYVRPSLGGYWCAFGLPLSTVALSVSPRLRALAMPLAVLSVAALALPFVAGSDWMGHHRFATAFLMLGHLSFAAACGAAWAEVAAPLGWVALGRAVAVSIPPACVMLLFAAGRDEYQSFLRSKYVGFALIADEEGFVRVDVQRYLGLTYPVVALPDAGGSTVVGGMQLVDTAYLADYHMARIRHDSSLVTQYELDERRVDLAEYHWWAFDKALVGTLYLPAARYDAEQDYPGFFPAYAVRRDLVESTEPGPGSERLGEFGGVEVHLSGRTVPLGAPGSLLRVELMLSSTGARAAAGCHVVVSVGDATDERAAFTLSPHSESPLAPDPGRYYRQGFLVPLSRAAGDYPLRVRLCPAENGPAFDASRRVMVRPVAELSLAELRERVGSAGDAEERAARVAQLREQLVPRLSQPDRTSLEEAFRASYRNGNRADVRAYDRLTDDSRFAYLEPMPEPIRVLEREVVDDAAEDARREWSDGSTEVGARTLAVGRRVDGLRRIGFLGTISSASWRPLVREIAAATSDHPDGVSVYARALGLALLEPQDAGRQKRLAAARLPGTVLPVGR